MSPRVLVLGANGMLGHRLFRTLGERVPTFATTRDPVDRWTGHPLLAAGDRVIGGVDASSPETVTVAVERARPDVVVNCIGIVKQRAEAADAIQSIRVNALFPHQLARRCREIGCRLIHISTDCVFSGRRGGYSEDDLPDPVDLYGRSKLLGEVVAGGCLTIRTSMIGRELAGEAGLLEWFLSRRGDRVKGFRNAVFSGLTTAALARIIGALVSDHGELEGLFHVASEPISKLELLVGITDALGLGVEIVPTDEPRCDRSLDGSRFTAATGLVVPSWDSMIAELATDQTPYDEWRREHATT